MITKIADFTRKCLILIDENLSCHWRWPWLMLYFFTYINYSKQKRHIEYHDKLGSHGVIWTFVLFQHDCIQSKIHKDMDEELGLEELCAFGMNQSKVDSGRLVWPHKYASGEMAKNSHKPHGKPSQETFTQVILICVWSQMSEYFQQCSVFLILLLYKTRGRKCFGTKEHQ